MNEDQDPFKDYYEEMLSKEQKETAAEFLSRLEAKASSGGQGNNIKEDADTIRAPINLFIKNVNLLIDKVFLDESEKKTRTDLVVTMVIGGLAYAVASLYYRITKTYNAKMTLEEYEATFLGMYQTAVKDMGKKENP